MKSLVDVYLKVPSLWTVTELTFYDVTVVSFYFCKKDCIINVY